MHSHALPLGVKSASLIGLAPWRCSVITRAAVAMQFFFTFSRFARKCSLRSPLHFSLHFVLNCPSPVHQSQPRAPHSPVASCPSPNSFMFPASSICFLSFIYTSLLAPRAPLLFVRRVLRCSRPPFLMLMPERPSLLMLRSIPVGTDTSHYRASGRVPPLHTPRSNSSLSLLHLSLVVPPFSVARASLGQRRPRARAAHLQGRVQPAHRQERRVRRRRRAVLPALRLALPADAPRSARRGATSMRSLPSTAAACAPTTRTAATRARRARGAPASTTSASSSL